MAIGRTDEQATPFGAKPIACRIRVCGLFGETHLGQRSCRHRVKGRTHERTRSERQIKQKTLALQGPSTHATRCPGSDFSVWWSSSATVQGTKREDP